MEIIGFPHTDDLLAWAILTDFRISLGGTSFELKGASKSLAGPLFACPSCPTQTYLASLGGHGNLEPWLLV